MTKMVLKRSVGTYTKMLGTDTVIHFTTAALDKIIIEWEISEIAQIRTLRYAILNGQVSELILEQQTLSLVLAQLLASILKKYPQLNVVQVDSICSPELEFLKLLSSLNKFNFDSNQYKCVVFFQSAFDFWEILHKKIETDSFANAVSVKLTDIGSFNWSTLDENSFILLNTFRLNYFLRKDMMKDLCDAQNTRTRTYLVVSRFVTDEEVAVMDIMNQSFVLPNLRDTLNQLVDAKWHVAYRFLPDMDRDFLLPFEGEYGVAILLISMNEELINSSAILDRYEKGETNKQDLVLFDKKITNNYSLNLSGRLIALDEPVDPNWHLWCKQFEWNPEETNFT